MDFNEAQYLLKQHPKLFNIKPLAKGGFSYVFALQKLNSKGQFKSYIGRLLCRSHQPWYLQQESTTLTQISHHKAFITLKETLDIDGYSLQLFEAKARFNLVQYIQKHGPLSSKQAKRLLIHLVESLEQLQQHKLLHTDIKPSNIVVGKKRFYLIDFSQALPESALFEKERLLGDAAYCPPERLNGHYDINSELYSVGLTLFYALTGKHLFAFKRRHGVWHKYYAQAFFQPNRLTKLPKKWRHLIYNLVQKSPHQRLGLTQLKQWLQTQKLDKTRHFQESETPNQYPEDCLAELSSTGLAYAHFKHANQLKHSQPEDAYQTMKTLALTGYSHAINGLGLMHELGQGCEKNPLLAKQLYQKALHQRNPFAAYNLGLLFQQGIGVHDDANIAEQCFLFAAERGNSSAQAELAKHYLQQTDHSRFKQAQYWLTLAARTHNKTAIRLLKTLQNTMN